MAALTKDVIRKRKGNGEIGSAAIVTAQTVYIGSLVAFTNAGGRVKTGIPTSGRVAGIVIAKDKSGANEAGTGVGNTGGTETVRFEYGYQYEMTVATAIATNTTIGKMVAISDDDTVKAVATGTVDAGVLVSFTNSTKTKGYVAIRHYVRAET